MDWFYQGDPTGTIANHVPILRIDELRSSRRLHGERRRLRLEYENQVEKFLRVEIITSYASRKRSISNMFVPVHVKTLDSDRCNIYLDPLAEATALGAFIHEEVKMKHEAVTMKKSGHVFGLGCITRRLKENDRCPMCRDKVTPPGALIHKVVKIRKCGHVFGLECITQWFRENDTCPMCRDKVALPVAYKLRAWVE